MPTCHRRPDRSVGPGPLLELAARGCARSRVDLLTALRDRGFERRALREWGGMLDLQARLVEPARLEQELREGVESYRVGGVHHDRAQPSVGCGCPIAVRIGDDG